MATWLDPNWRHTVSNTVLTGVVGLGVAAFSAALFWLWRQLPSWSLAPTMGLFGVIGASAGALVWFISHQAREPTVLDRACTELTRMVGEGIELRTRYERQPGASTPQIMADDAAWVGATLAALEGLVPGDFVSDFRQAGPGPYELGTGVQGEHQLPWRTVRVRIDILRNARRHLGCGGIVEDASANERRRLPPSMMQ